MCINGRFSKIQSHSYVFMYIYMSMKVFTYVYMYVHTHDTHTCTKKLLHNIVMVSDIVNLITRGIPKV